MTAIAINTVIAVVTLNAGIILGCLAKFAEEGG